MLQIFCEFEIWLWFIINESVEISCRKDILTEAKFQRLLNIFLKFWRKMLMFLFPESLVLLPGSYVLLPRLFIPSPRSHVPFPRSSALRASFVLRTSLVVIQLEVGSQKSEEYNERKTTSDFRLPTPDCLVIFLHY